MLGRITSLLALALAASAFAAPAQAQAADWNVNGRGSGHGVGMSQYGAYGFAKQGEPYGRILRHYYTGVEIAPAQTRDLRVLIAAGLSSVNVTGADEACGESLDPGSVYTFRLESGSVSLRRPNGSELAGCGQEGVAQGGETVVFSGVGVYRGDLRARNVGGSLFAINKVPLEGYVQGVIPNESSPSWPQAALQAQAVAARSYALATRINGDGYELYDDTRSQTYGGVASEAQATNQAARATAGEVITSAGAMVPAYFFSSSGGRTENSEFGFSGGSPRAYLKSVSDPFDDFAPSHRWRVGFSQAEMESKLAGLFQGNLKKIKVLKRGVSPRIVQARVVGSQGSSRVSGDSLRFRLGLLSTWARFDKR